jgi:hypothetical protein
MNREAFLALLVRGVSDGWLSETEAADLLARFTAGELVYVQEPLQPSQAIRGVERDDDLLRAALAALLAVLLFSMGGRRTFGPPLETFHLLPLTTRIFTIDELQTAFERQTRSLARQLGAGQLDLAGWQTAMQTELRQHLTAQTMAGLGRDTLTPRELARLNTLARQETAYLARFADQIAIAQAQGTPLSVAQIGARSELYAGAGRGEFFRAVETSAIADGRIGPGNVVRYVAIGDANTCSPCLAAVGYYLPGEGPVPGQVCRGHGRCRCRRMWLFDPARYAELTGGTARGRPG